MLVVWIRWQRGQSGIIRRLTLGNVHGVPSEAGALPDETAFLGKERRDFAAHKLV